MNRFTLFIWSILLWGGWSQVFSQQGYSYKEYSRDICLSTERSYGRIPDEVFFQVEFYDNSFWATFNDELWFDDFFGGEDGISLFSNELSLGVQLVSTDFFSCNSSGTKGYEDFFFQLEPVGYRQMKKQQIKTEYGMYVVNLGDVPTRFTQKDYDMGVIISKRGRKCLSHWYTKIPYHDWDLLPPALLLDTLVFVSGPVVSTTSYLPVSIEKRYDFDVIFPKNEIQFSRDSLRRFLLSIPGISDATVKIEINAFASIEGPENRNKELYQKRGDVVYSEIISLLTDTIEVEIKVDENWEDFYRDIASGPFAYLHKESPESIREKLQNRAFSEELELLLKRHRKATVSVFMQNTIETATASPQVMVDFYVETLRAKDIQKALQLQDAIFGRMISENIVVTFPDSLPIPSEKDFSFIFNRDYVNRYLSGITDINETYDLFFDLKKYYPDDGRISFNLAEFMFRKWLAGKSLITADSVLASINRLEALGVPATAYNRLLINYHLVSIRKSMADKDLRTRTRSVRAVRNLYGATITRESELINMARFFVAYKQNNVAERLLRPFARVAEPDEELLFYYIALTINDESISNLRYYNDLLEKAQKINSQRFCKLFQPVTITDSAGISLLFKPKYKEIYCRHCEGPS
jgi:hypothetical protein